MERKFTLLLLMMPAVVNCAACCVCVCVSPVENVVVIGANQKRFRHETVDDSFVKDQFASKGRQFQQYRN